MKAKHWYDYLAVLKDMLEKLGFSPDVRGESLSPEDFLRLAS